MVIIHPFWDEGRIEIDSGVKIIKDIESFRGGYRLNILIKNNNDLITKVKNVIELFLNYINIQKRKLIKEKLKNFDNIIDISDIMKYFGSYNITITGILLLLVLKS